MTLRRFALDRLRRSTSFDTDPSDGIMAVKVTLLRLARTGSGYERVTIEVGPSDHVDICARSRQWFGDTDPLSSSDWYVSMPHCALCFTPKLAERAQRLCPFNCEHLTVRTCEIRLASINCSHRSA